MVSGELPSPNQVSLELLPGGAVRVRFAGIPGRRYDLQRAAVLPGPWITLTTVIAPLHGIIEYVDVAPPVGGAFYRTTAP